VVPLEYQVEFSKVRYLTPHQFVEKLSTDLRIKGVVAGTNILFCPAGSLLYCTVQLLISFFMYYDR
jgi:hypothetical protein